MTRLGRIIAATAAVTGAVTLSLVAAPAASAHPLGNFTVSSHSAIRVEPAAVSVDVVVDSAEIPTLQALPGAREGLTPAEDAAYRDDGCTDVVAGTQLALDGDAVPLRVVASALSFPPGEAGLPTTRLTCELRGEAATVGTALTFSSSVTADRVGWREVTLVGDGVELTDATVPSESASAALTAYPEDLLSSPLDQRTAAARVTAGSGEVGAQPAAPGAPDDSVTRGVDRLTAAYTGLVASRDLTFGFGLLAVLLATLLGGLHAFAPGHGKALMAASLVGRHGSLRDAALIGLSVTVTHSVGVLLLGVALTVTSLAAPEQVYPWLALVSGVLLIAIGTTLLRSALRRRHDPAPVVDLTPVVGVPVLAEVGAHPHPHPHGHDHEHEHAGPTAPAEPHSHGLFSHSHEPPARLDARSMLAVGFTGGLVPSPSALLVLLGGIALGRTWFGVLLVLAYGVGMAAALVGVGLALVRCRDWLEATSARLAARGRGRTVGALGRALPALTATLVVVIGLGVAARGLYAI